MCVRIVLVFCYVQTWAQPMDLPLSGGFLDRDENPDMHPQGGPPPPDQLLVLPDLLEHPDIPPHPGPPGQSPGLPNIPANAGMPPEERPPPLDQSPDIPGMQEHQQGRPPLLGPPPETPASPGQPEKHPHGRPSLLESMDLNHADHLKPPDAEPKPKLKVKMAQEHSNAGVPENLTVVALPLKESDHELQLNVSWLPPSGVPAKGYTVVVTSVTETHDCSSQDCYQTVNKTWVLVPESWTSVPGGCAIRPGCAYLVKVNADPWDGYTTANLTKEFKECEAGVCSCAYSPRLPSPVVSAVPVTIKNKLYSNVSWYLPTPNEPQRLPAGLKKQSYIITLHKQVTTLNNRTIFTKLQNRMVQVNISSPVFEGDSPRWITILISPEMADKKKLMVTVELVDRRGCIGGPGNATVFDPAKKEKLQNSTSKLSLGVYATLGALIGAWAMGAVFVLSARVVKRVLKSFRPAPVSAPLEPLRRRPAWFPLQLRT